LAEEVAKPYKIVFDSKEWDQLKLRLISTIDLMNNDWQKHNALIPIHSSHDKRWKMGTDIDQLKSLVEYWRDSYDWEAHVESMNKYMPHFETIVDEITVRFAWRRAKNPGQKVILIVHGWPGSVWEFNKIIDTLCNDHGFDVVAPSIPGYGYSSVPTQHGYDYEGAANTFIKLMQKLGYDKYIVQGGDWGSFIGEFVARNDPDHCIGYHSNMCVSIPKWQDFISLAVGYVKGKLFGSDESQTEELTMSNFVTDVLKYITEEGGYQQMQTTKPDSIGVAFLDSPVGLLNYIIDKFFAWSDLQERDETNLFNKISRDDILTNVMIYYTTRTIATSMRLYYNTKTNPNHEKMYKKQALKTPTACAVFNDLFRSPKATAERNFNLVQYTRYNKGGHFAALELPKELVEDIVNFYNKLSTVNDSKEKTEL